MITRVWCSRRGQAGVVRPDEDGVHWQVSQTVMSEEYVTEEYVDEQGSE